MVKSSLWWFLVVLVAFSVISIRYNGEHITQVGFPSQFFSYTVYNGSISSGFNVSLTPVDLLIDLVVALLVGIVLAWAIRKVRSLRD